MLIPIQFHVHSLLLLDACLRCVCERFHLLTIEYKNINYINIQCHYISEHNQLITLNVIKVLAVIKITIHAQCGQKYMET